MKHAYLIIAHKDFYILEKLINSIDNPQNDIFIHIDKKVSNFDKQKFSSITSYSRVFYVKNYNVCWGEYSQIEAELSLFESAYKNDNYRYFHLISGSDMILKNQEWIYEFFLKNDGYEFLQCRNKEYLEVANPVRRFQKFYHIEKASFIRKKYMEFFNAKYNRGNNDFDVSIGGNWASITNEFVEYILENKAWIKKNFVYSHACDEVYKQCLAINSKFKTRLYENKEKIFMDLEQESCISFNLRYIDWSVRGAHPKILTSEDFDNIVNSNCIFARKFSTEVDKVVIDRIYDSLKG